MPLGTSTLPWSPTKYSMDTYSILRQINFQGLRCVTYTTWLRELLISQIWHFFRLSPKLVQNCLEAFQKRYIHDSVWTKIRNIQYFGMHTVVLLWANYGLVKIYPLSKGFHADFVQNLVGYVIPSIVKEGYTTLPCQPCDKSAPLTVYILIAW